MAVEGTDGLGPLRDRPILGARAALSRAEPSRAVPSQAESNQAEPSRFAQPTGLIHPNTRSPALRRLLVIVTRFVRLANAAPTNLVVGLEDAIGLTLAGGSNDMR